MAANDGSEFRAALIQSYIETLVSPLGGVKQPISAKHAGLRAMHRKGDHAGMVGFVKNSMRLETNIRLGLVNSGGPKKAPAWVEIPDVIPHFGSTQFAQMQFTMYLRKSFLAAATFEQVVSAIAHEMSHIVLAGIGHKLRSREKAVDLTAMMLGYREFFIEGLPKSPGSGNPFDFLAELVRELLTEGGQTFTLGYLTPEETRFAAKLISAKQHRR